MFLECLKLGALMGVGAILFITFVWIFLCVLEDVGWHDSNGNLRNSVKKRNKGDDIF